MALLALALVWPGGAAAALVANFNRSLSPVSPMVKAVSSNYSTTYVSNATLLESSVRDPQSWRLHVDLRGVNATSRPPMDAADVLYATSEGHVTFTFNGSGLKMYMTALEGGLAAGGTNATRSNATGANEQDLLPAIKVRGPAGRPIRNVLPRAEGAGHTVVAETPVLEPNEYTATVHFPPRSLWSLDNITLMYSIPQEE